MKSTQESLMNVIEFGQNLLQEYKDKPQDQMFWTALFSLIYIENILDGGRKLIDIPDDDARLLAVKKANSLV